MEQRATQCHGAIDVDVGGPDTLKVWRVVTPAEARATDVVAPEATPGGNPAPAR